MKITNVKTIITAPARLNLVVVKIETSEPGLFGLGCATFAWRSLVVQSILDNYLKPFLIGRDPQRIEDIWQQSAVSGYWRNGPEFNNALSGVDIWIWLSLISEYKNGVVSIRRCRRFFRAVRNRRAHMCIRMKSRAGGSISTR